MLSFEKRFRGFLEREKLILPGEAVDIACSGGPDSVALVFLLQSIALDWKLRLRILHLNHGLRGKQSDADARFVAALARKLKFRFESKKQRGLRLKAKLSRESLEETARQMRYDFLICAAKKGRVRKVALAHHQDDQAETVLMRLIQGTGPRGLRGIQKSLTMKRVQLIRPLLPFSKKEILSYLKSRKIKFRKDLSNRSSKYLRNKIRNQLLPMLRKNYNPGIVRALARIPESFRDEQALIQTLEEQAFKSVVSSARKGSLFFRKKVFLFLAPALQYRVLDKALQKLHPKSGMNFDAWQEIKSHLNRRVYRHSLKKEITFSITPSKIHLKRKLTGR